MIHHANRYGFISPKEIIGVECWLADRARSTEAKSSSALAWLVKRFEESCRFALVT
jgi:hypothetical protein